MPLVNHGTEVLFLASFDVAANLPGLIADLIVLLSPDGLQKSVDMKICKDVL